MFEAFQSVDVVSFDIFDTLLLRSFLRPQDLWLKIGGEVYAKERAGADRGGFDTIDDAYAIMHEEWQGLKEVELQSERACLVVNPEMLELWNMAGQMGKKRVIISDMYLPSAFLKTVLQTSGVSGWDGFYVSCERKARKSTGELYKIMLSEMNVEPDRVLHIGDNVQSDGEAAQRIGLHVLHYERVSDRFILQNAFIKRFLSVNNSLDARILVGALAIAWHKYLSTRDRVSGWGRIGGLLGGVFGAAYIDFIVKEVKARKIDHLLFVARDGYSLQKIFNAVMPEIKTDYVYAPRYVRNAEDILAMEEYKRYVASLGIASQNVGVVDTVSKSFTSEFLLSSALGRCVMGFYAVAFSPVRTGACFLYTPNNNLRWPNLLELLYMAPTPPVVRVENNVPVYMDPVNEDEQKRIDIYPSISDAEINVANQLLDMDVRISPEMWLDYIDSFLEMMDDDVRRLVSSIRNGDDYMHTRYVPLLKDAKPKSIWYTRMKIPYKKQVVMRRGLKMVRIDYLFGIIKFRERVEDL